MKPIPQALYSCKYCYEDASWPADGLWWSEHDEGWVCDICWPDRDWLWDGDEMYCEPKGTTLAAEIERQKQGDAT